MKMIRPIAMVITLSAGLYSAMALSGELVYHPVNPSFGGNPMNGGMLLSNAQAQDNNKNPETREQMSNVDRLLSSLQSRLLSQLLNDIGSGESGTLVTDEYHIEVSEDPDGAAVITVRDFTTDQTTTIEVNGIASQANVN